MDEAIASVCAAIACSPADRSTLVQVALESIPFSIKEAFGKAPWSWETVNYIEKTTPMILHSATGVYAYHLTKINKEDRQNFYVGQTTNSFARRLAAHDGRRKAERRPKIYSSKFYGNLKLTKPKDIHIFILADISVVQEDVLAHKVMAIILEAGFCVFFDSLRSSNFRRSDESISFALRWSAIRAPIICPSHLLTNSPSRPADIPVVPWTGLNFAFPLFQSITLRPWLDEEIDILERTQERDGVHELSQEILAKAGYKRSLLAISSMRKSLRLRYFRRW
jgi:hypothetical protein